MGDRASADTGGQQLLSANQAALATGDSPDLQIAAPDDLLDIPNRVAEPRFGRSGIPGMLDPPHRIR